MRFTNHDSSSSSPVDLAASAAAETLSRRPARGRHKIAPLLEAMVQLAPDATIATDTNGRVRLVNRQTEELFGYSADQLLGQPVELLIPNHLRALHQQHRAEYAAAPYVRRMGTNPPLSGKRQDGSEFPLEASLGPLDVGGESLVIISIRDITERQRVKATHAATQAANQDLRALQALTDSALSHLALDDLLTALLERITDILHVDNAAVLLLDPSGQTLTAQAVLGLDEPGLSRVQVSVGEGFAGRIAATREPLVVDDITTFPVAHPLLRDQLRSLAGVPLVVGAQLLGVVHVGTVLPRHFSAYDVHLLQQVADRIALAIDRARLYRAEQQAREMAEAARAEAEQQAAQLAAIFEAMADGVVVFDTKGQLVQENAAHQRLLGIDGALPQFAELPLTERLALFAARDEWGRPLGAEDGPLPRALRGEVLSGAETMDMLSRTLDGREVELSVSAAPMRDRDGHVTGAVGIFRDQTEHKRLERERAMQAEQLDRIFEGIADGLVVYNAEGHPVRLNTAARRILGLDAGPLEYSQMPVPDRAILYKAFDDQGHPLAPEAWPLIRVLSGQVAGADTREIRLCTLDGREVEVITSAAPLWDSDGHLQGVVTILHDQTERKRLAREREDARAHELALEDTARHMDEFLATASHDLRTPLTVVKSRVQMALRRLARLREREATLSDALPDAEMEALHASLLEANHSADRLTRLGTLLFDVARARSGRLDLQLSSCDLAALVSRNAGAQQVAAPERRIMLEIPAKPVLVKADADRLDQVVSNYLTNALKYSPDDRPVTVRLEVVEGAAIVSVADHGPGLAPEELSRIWDLFHRVPGIEVQSGSNEVSASMGLGLHICKQLIELHPGGSVGVESVIGAGSTFWFRLPLPS